MKLHYTTTQPTRHNQRNYTKTNCMNKILILLSFSMIAFVGCNKDDDKKDDIIEKKGIAMNGAQEVPAKAVTGTGTADVSYNKTTKVLSFKLTWAGLTGEPTGSHIHGIAAKGVNAGVKFDFFDAIPKTVSGTYSSTATVDEVAILEDSLLAGKYYFNIHTVANPGGEIRGQIEF